VKEGFPMEAKAIAKYVRISPLKVNFICKEIRGKQVDEALAILRYTPKRGAKVLKKVLTSAVDRENLYVAEAYANDGPTLKRWRPRAKGMAYPILKRSSHIGVTVKEKE
jgi:large subunit ribosomal protein L22